jgi:acyl carrier protein
MEEQLRNMVAKIAEITPTFAGDANLRDDLRVDSVRAFELVFEIERTFGVKFPEDRYAEVVTFSDLLGVVTSLKH